MPKLDSEALDFLGSIGTPDEAREAQRSRSQSVIFKRGQNIKYLPLAFTEHGAIMAATHLRAPRCWAR